MKVMLPLGSCVIQIKSLPYTRNQETNSINLKQGNYGKDCKKCREC